METGLILAAALAGALVFLSISWLSELLAGGWDQELMLSTDERLALEAIQRFQEKVDRNGGYPQLGRRSIWKHICWHWRSARIVVLRSGRWSAVPWLAMFAALCCILVVKTLIHPRTADLRLLLGGQDFLSLAIIGKRRAASGEP